MSGWLLAVVAGGALLVVLGSAAVKLLRLSRRRRSAHVGLDDVVGADAAVARLRDVVERLVGGDDGPTGVLLHGAEGVGKRLLASAVATDARVRSIDIAVGGEPGDALDERFEEARSAAPSLFVLDGIEHARPSTVRRVAGYFDQLRADGVPVVVVGIATDVDRVDPALRGGGCFGDRIAVESLTVRDRIAVLRSLTARLPLDIGVDLTALAHRTPGFTRAELEQVVRIAEAAGRDRSRTSMIVADDLYTAVAGVVARRPLTGSDPDGELRTRAAYRAAAQLVVVAAAAPEALPHRVSIAEWRTGLGSDDLTVALLDRLGDLPVVVRLSVTMAPLAGERVALGRQAELGEMELGLARTVASEAIAGSDPGGAFKRLVEDGFARALRQVRRGQVELHQLALALLIGDTIESEVIDEIVGAGGSPQR